MYILQKQLNDNKKKNEVKRVHISINNTESVHVRPKKKGTAQITCKQLRGIPQMSRNYDKKYD